MKNNLFIVLLSALLLMTLASCGNSKDQPSESTMSQTDADKERLQTEVDASQSKLEQATPQPQSVDVQPLQIAPKQRSLEEKLIGEWFDQGSLVDMESVRSFTFNADGTGSEIIMDYGSASDTVSHADPGYTGEEIYNMTWSLDGNIINLVYDKDSLRNTRYTFSDSEQQLQWHDKDGSIRETFVRMKPTVPDGYVEMATLLGQHKVTEAALVRRFLGEWCWDVMIWRFNDDGTGVIDIPAFGKFPADKKEFDFTVSENSEVGDAFLNISWADGKQSMYFATFGNESGGSVTLAPHGGSTILLTRSYDMSNSPITDEILQEGADLFESVTDPAGYFEGILQDKLVESIK